MRLLVISLRVIVAINSTYEDNDDTDDAADNDAFVDDVDDVANDQWWWCWAMMLMIYLSKFMFKVITIYWTLSDAKSDADVLPYVIKAEEVGGRKY